MTKAIIKFPVKRVSYAPRFMSRRFPQSRNESVAYKEEGEDAAAREELLKTIQSKIDLSLATRATKEELKAIADEQKESLKGISLDALRAMADDKSGAMATLAAQGLEITRLKTQMQAEKPVDMSVRGQVAAWMEKNKETLLAVREGRSKEIPALEIRALASPMTVATVNSGSSAYIGRVEQEGGINGIMRFPNTFWDTLTKGRTNSPTYVWANQVVPEGAAAFIGPGVAKPGVSFSIVADNSIAKKIADSAKAGTELLQDIDGMTTFIEQELKAQLLLKVNETLMTATASSTVPAGIRTLSVAYTLVGVETTAPTYVDCLRAVVAQLRSGKLSGEITIFINSVDAANMDMAKATTSGVYMLPPFVTANGMTVAGARVIEDSNIPVGSFQAAFLHYYRILIYKDFSISWGWENDDFTKNLVTAVGEMRLHQFVNQIHTGAFIYDQFADVQVAITAV